MTKPHYFSMKCIFGDYRGFFFALSWSICILATFGVSYSQNTLNEPSTAMVLVFGPDTLVLNRQVPQIDVDEAVYAEAWRHGYFRSSLISTDRRGDTLLAVFNYTERFKWTDQSIEWTYDVPQAITDHNCVLSGRWYTADDLDACVDVRVDLLAKLGFLNPIVVMDSLKIDYDKSSVSAIVSITIGEQALLSDVTWIGLSRTGSQWLQRAAGIHPGIILNESNIRRTTRRLYQMRLFDGISEPEIYTDGNAWGLIYTVIERPLTFFDLLVGYVPDQSGKAVVAGTGSLQVRNAGFDGTDLKLDFDRQSPRVGRLHVEIDQNLLFGLPFGVSSSFSLIRQDTLWQNRTASIGFWWDMHDNLRIQSNINREVSTASSLSQGSANLWGTYGQIGITFDSRNDYELTSTGLVVNLMAESGRQIVDPALGERYNQNRKRLNGAVDVHIPINPRNILISGVTAGTILSERAPFINSLWRIGGTKSLRGYREDQFFATSYIWGNIEYRFLLDPYSYLFAFGSSGWLWLPFNELQTGTSERKEVGSFGFGLAYQTNLGLLKFTYAKSPEDPFSNAKVHIGISSGF